MREGRKSRFGTVLRVALAWVLVGVGLSHELPAQTIIAYAADPGRHEAAFYTGARRITGVDTLAALHLERGNADSVLVYAEAYRRRALAIADTAARRHRVVTALDWLGRANTIKGLYETALQQHVSGLRAFGPPLDSGLYWSHFVERARVTGALELEEKALVGFAEAEQAFRQRARSGPGSVERDAFRQNAIRYPDLATRLYQARAILLMRIGPLSAAAADLGSADSVLATSPDVFLANRQRYLRALLAERSEDSPGARAQLAALLDQTRASGDYGLYRRVVLALGSSFLEDGEEDAASMVLTSALTNAYQWDDLVLQRDALDQLRTLEARRGNTANAYALMTQMAAVDRRLRAEQDAGLARRLEAEFEGLRKQAEIDELELNAERRRTRQLYLLLGFIAFLVPVIALLYTFYQKLRRESELGAARAAAEAQDHERARIGRQLHDTVGGNLAAIKMQLSRMGGGGGEHGPSLVNAVDETYTMVRDLSHDLVPVRFRESGLDAALRGYLQRIGGADAPAVEYVAYPPEAIDALPDRTQAELFAVVQELITNTLKHADARHAELSITVADGELALMYADDGKGFDMAVARTGLGLHSLRTRVAGLGGRLDVDALPGRGCTFALTIPLA